MLASEYILIDITLISYSPSFTNITEHWNIPSAFYLYPATVPGNSDTEYQHSRKPWTLYATMRAFIIAILTLVFGQVLVAQDFDDIKMKQTKAILAQKKIPLRRVISHNGFIVYYNCDSIPFLKKIIGDTIKIWTEISNFAMDVAAVDKYIMQDDFGKTIYIKDILSNGRVTISGMHQTVFINRNDSLFEVESGYEKEGPKLIFHPKMFANGRTKFTVSKKYNYLGDQIVLEQAWIKNRKKHYVIRINNKDEQWDTTYSYAFDEGLRFIYWEKCDN